MIDVNPEDLMTPEEIRFRAHRGCPEYILAELNACSVKSIHRILAGEDLQPKPRKHWIVVNVTEGRFYPSIYAAERKEGIKKDCLSAYFRRHGSRIKYKGTIFHLYRRSSHGYENHMKARTKDNGQNM